ncbi:hypothetical protein [Blastococcus sp. SYSU DS0619]
MTAQPGDRAFTHPGGVGSRALGSLAGHADQEPMTSSATPTATWLPAAMVRAAVVHSPAAAPARGRHRAPEFEPAVQVADEEQPTRRGRHAEPEEEDSLAWLGFRLRRD